MMAFYSPTIYATTKDISSKSYIVNDVQWNNTNLSYDQTSLIEVSLSASSLIHTTFAVQHRVTWNGISLMPGKNWHHPELLPHTQTLSFNSSVLPIGMHWIQLESRIMGQDSYIISGGSYISIGDKTGYTTIQSVQITESPLNPSNVDFHVKNQRCGEVEDMHVTVSTTSKNHFNIPVQYRVLKNGTPDGNWTASVDTPHTLAVPIRFASTDKGKYNLSLQCKIANTNYIRILGFGTVYLGDEIGSNAGCSKTISPGSNHFTFNGYIDTTGVRYNQEEMITASIQTSNTFYPSDQFQYRLEVNGSNIFPEQGWSDKEFAPYSKSFAVSTKNIRNGLSHLKLWAKGLSDQKEYIVAESTITKGDIVETVSTYEDTIISYEKARHEKMFIRPTSFWYKQTDDIEIECFNVSHPDNLSFNYRVFVNDIVYINRSASLDSGSNISLRVPKTILTKKSNKVYFEYMFSDGTRFHEKRYIKREDPKDLTIKRNFPYNAAEWDAENIKDVDEKAYTDNQLYSIHSSGTSTPHSQIITTGRKSIESITVNTIPDGVYPGCREYPIEEVKEGLYKTRPIRLDCHESINGIDQFGYYIGDYVHVVNQSGSSSFNFPSHIRRGDKLIFNNTSTGRSGTIIDWTVPKTGVYWISCWGARGGHRNNTGGRPGYGANLGGDFLLLRNQTVRILVGQMGSNSTGTTGCQRSGGGGGGTFIYQTGESLPLIVAGGGAGQSGSEVAQGGKIETGNGMGNVAGGWETSGSSGSNIRYLNGIGGVGSGALGDGGFGGGAGGLSCNIGGGGGGYSGGGQREGGLSYNSKPNQSGIPDIRNNHGLVEITLLHSFGDYGIIKIGSSLYHKNANDELVELDVSYENFINLNQQQIDDYFYLNSSYSSLTSGDLDFLRTKSPEIEFLINDSYIHDYEDSVLISAKIKQKTSFALSNDERKTWYTLQDNNWQLIEHDDIKELGLSAEQLTNINSETLSQLFENRTIDFVFNMTGWHYDLNGVDAMHIPEIEVSLAPSQGARFENTSVTPPTHRKESVVLRSTIIEDSDQSVQYRIHANDTLIVDWGESTYTPLSIENIIEFDYKIFRVGENTLTIEVKNFEGTITTEEISVEVANHLPEISVIQESDYIFSARISDDDDDDLIRYRTFINGNLHDDWSEWTTQGLFIYTAWDSQKIIIGGENTFRIEFEDNFFPGYIQSYQYDFYGQYRNLIFLGPDQQAFSDDQGNILEEIDLGEARTGENTIPKKVYLKNTLDIPMKNITIQVVPERSQRHSLYLLSKDTPELEFRHFITIDNVIQPNEEIVFYIQVQSTITDSSWGRFRLRAYGMQAQEE